MNKTEVPISLLWVLPAILLMAIGAALVIDRAEASRSAIPIFGGIPDFEFIQANGAPFRAEQMSGKLHVVDFFFTNCPNVCPRMAEVKRELYQLYANSDKVQLISISVDPERDTLAALRSYAEQNGVTDDRWIFLRGPIEKVANFCEKGLSLSAVELPAGHPTRFTLIDRQGRIRGYYSFDDKADIILLKRHLRQLARESS